MPTTQEILSMATELGQKVAKHEAVVQFESVVKALQQDVDAQRLLNDYQRHIAEIGQKEAEGKPIEVEDKRRLTTLQNDVAHNAILRDLQIKQMDYLDLMRQIDEAIASQSSIGQAPQGGGGAVPQTGEALS